MLQLRLRRKTGYRTQDKSQSNRAGTSQRVTTLVQGTSQVHISGGNFSVVGGDSQTHFHSHETTLDLESILRAIPNFRKIQQDTLAKATPGTGAWLLKGDKFCVWLEPNGDIRILWGSGIPGAGKTVIAALVIDLLQALSRKSGNRICVGFVYIRYSDRDQVTVRAILETLVVQTIERHPDCRSVVAALYNCHRRERTQPTEAELLELLREFIRKMDITFYVLDALDEAPVGVRFDLIEKLSSLGARLFITSRPLQVLEAKFPDAHTISIVAQDKDLDLHIAEKFDTSETLQDLLQGCNPALKRRLVDVVKSKCNGMFLHASLQIDALQHCLTLHDVMATLKGFPARIEDVYHQTWERIMGSESRHACLAQSALVWVLNARWSMTIDQLRHALAVSPDTHNFESSRLVSEAALIAICHGLLIVDEESRIVRLVHYTAQRPLEELLGPSFPHPHHLLARVCMTHLTNCGLQDASIMSGEQLQKILHADPLLDYAHNAWAFHAYQDSAKQLNDFVAHCKAFPASIGGFDGFDLLGPLHLAAFCDLPLSVAGPNATENPNVSTRILGYTPLGLACSQGNQRAAEALLQCPNILVNQPGAYGATPLLFAALGHSESITKLLLDRPEIDVNSVHSDGGSALQQAAIQGHAGITKLLLARPEIDVNMVDIYGRSALMAAASFGHKAAAKLLLADPRIDVNLVVLSNHSWSALMIATKSGCVDIVKRFLAHPKIQVNTANFHGSTALTLASEYGHTKIVKLLLAFHGHVDVNLFDGDGDTAIKLAAHNGHEDIVRMLLGVPGVDIGIASPKDGHTAMSAALANGHKNIVRLLQDFESTHNLEASHLKSNAAVEAVKDDGGEEVDAWDSDDSQVFEDAQECL